MLLEVSNIDVFYEDIQVLFSVSLHVDDGEIVAVIGANGAGKTTLLRTVSGLLRPRQGTITFNGQRIDGLPTSEIVGRGLIHVPEGRRIFPGLTVWENLVVAGLARYRRRKELNLGIDRVFGLFPFLRERKSQLGWSLSGGEQQMLALARGLIARPKLLVLDEPSLGLAPVIVDRLFDTIANVHREDDLTVLLVEQNAYMALEVATRGYVLETGKVVLEDSSSGLLKNEAVLEAYLGA